jgi:hopanoid-associated phosphorylase
VTVQKTGALVVVVGLGFEARIAAGPNVRVICSGDGTNLAGRLDHAIAAGCRGLLSFGMAGGLARELRPGTCVVASEIVSERGRLSTDPRWLRNLLHAIPRAFRGLVLGSPVPVVCATAKAALWRQTGAHAVDMESHIVAQAAAAHGLPVATIRVIADPAHRSVPGCALAGMRPDGRTDPLAVFRSLRRQPRELPALVRAALDCRAAVVPLLRGRRLLGPGFGFPDFAELELDVTREHMLGGPLAVEGDFGRHVALRARAAQGDC